MADDSPPPRHVAAGARGRKSAGFEDRVPGFLAALTAVAVLSLGASLLAYSASGDARDLASDAVTQGEENETEILRSRENGYLTRAGICEGLILDGDRPADAAPPAYCTTPEVARNYSPAMCLLRPTYCATTPTSTTPQAPTATGARPAG